MSRFVCFLFFVLISTFILSGQENAIQKLYVGTFTSEGAEGIYLCNFDTETGKIELDKTFKGLDNPSFLEISPNRKYLYSVNRVPNKVESSGGYVTAYEIKENGSLNFINKQLSHGSAPCHIDVSQDGKFVAIATYVGGTVSLYPVAEGGGLKKANTVIKNQGSGANERRQKDPHAHCVKFSPYDNQVFNADLGTDQLNVFLLKDKKLIRQDSVEMAPGAGPRHFNFHPDKKIIYVINELNSTITAVRNMNDNWKKFQTISTLPPDFTGDNSCADIHVSADGRFLYGSNRGHNSIAVFEIDPQEGRLNFIKTVSSEGDWPRNFTLSPDGNYLLVANQRSNNIAVYRINKDSGIPEFTGNDIELPAPVCLEFY